MDDDEQAVEYGLSEKTVTCHVEGCVNCDVPINFVCADDIVCVCGAPIKDVRSVAD